MARKLKAAQIDSKDARRRLRPSNKPYWASVERGKVHLGYRKLAKGKNGKAPSGSWIARYYLGNETYQLEKIGIADDWSDADGFAILNFDQAVEASRARMVIRAENASGSSKRPWTVQDAMDEYLAYLENEKKTGRDARYKVEAFILPKFGKREIATLTVDELRRWFADLAKTPPRIRTAKAGKKAKAQQYRAFDADDDDARRKRKATANRVLTTFRAALNRAWKDGKVKSDSAWRRLAPYRGVEVAREEFLTVDEAKRLINACPADFSRLTQAALVSGCRYGELTRLTVADVHEGNKTISIRTSKSGSSRHVILTDEGARFFSQLGRGRPRSDILLQRANGQPWRSSQQVRLMREACKRARIKPAVGFHALRHTWASLSIMGGVPMMVVARNLGHTTTRMTEKHYGHLLRSFEKDEIRKGAPRFGIQTSAKIASLTHAR